MKAILIVFLVSTSTAMAAPKDDARVVVDTWVKAQNGNDLDAYAALYAPKFKGIKRTTDGGEKTLTLAKWKADRKRMFKAAQKVAAEDVKVLAKGDGFVVTFVQRYKSGSYADHGHKELVLAPDKAGKLKIVREELRASIPGWETDTSKVVDATKMKSPFTVRLRTEVAERDGDTARLAVIFTLRDANKVEIVRELGSYTEYADMAGKVDPSGDGTLFDISSAPMFGGVQYMVRRSGDAIVATSRDSEVGTAEEKGWVGKAEPIFTVTLPPKATVAATK
jgi:ketosteroid isomerase-like protein